MSLVYLFYFRAPVLTGVKVLLGCMSFGLFGGMLSFLSMEKRVMDFLRKLKVDRALGPKRVLSVSTKMLFFMVTVMVFMFVVALLT